MKVISTFLIALFISTAFGESSQFEAQSTLEMEGLLKSYLANYLQPSEYLVMARIKPVPQSTEPKKSDVELPGLPGWRESGAEGNATHSYYDADGKFHMAFEDRPPMTISVIIDSAVDKQKVQLFKKILPEIARLRFDRGDELKFSTGKLDKAPAQEPIKAPEPSWLDNVVKYKDTLIRLLGGIVAAIGVLLILQAVLRAVFPSKFNEVSQKPQIRPRSNQTPEPREADNSDKSQKAASALPGRGSEIASKLPERVGRLGLGGINRNQLFSRDSLLYHTLLELNQEATDHPERLAQMLVEWISVGKKQAAATLLNNFDMKIAERILERMSDSDVDLIQPFFSGQLDPFSEENHKVVNEARHDLIRLTAKRKKRL
jgi:hypothetical protein